MITNELGWEELRLRRYFHCLILMYKIKHGVSPKYLVDICPPNVQDVTHYNLRSSQNIRFIACNYVPFSKSFFPFIIKKWNNIDVSIRESISVVAFKNRLAQDMFLPKTKLFPS